MDNSQREKLLLAVRSGTDLDTSCHYAGLSVAEVYRDLERGKAESSRLHDGDEPKKSEEWFLQFWRDLSTARADAIVRNVASVQQAAQNGSWQAAAWWLERVVPEAYSKTSQERQRKPIDSAQGEIAGT